MIRVSARRDHTRRGAGLDCGISPHMSGEHHSGRGDVSVRGVGSDRERAIAELAAKQHGVVTRTQLYGVGVGRHSIDHRLRRGRLHPLHRGVYLVGHTAAPQYAREMAAVMACGPGAVVSHRSAALLWQLLPHPAQPAPVDVTVPGRDPGNKPGIRIHRASMLATHDTRACRGVPATTPGRTLIDLAAQVSARELERALAEAQSRRLIRQRDLPSVLDRHRGRRGIATLRAFLEDGTAVLTRSEAEDRVLSLIRSAALPIPDVNAPLAGYEVDFLWLEEGLVVEVDGFAFHSSRTAFERDRMRDAELQARGYRVMRVTWRQIVEHREATLARITRALAIGG
jgi:very-short-patch-repair endonuclease/predicted transcriptional regulator of viral defense system